MKLVPAITAAILLFASCAASGRIFSSTANTDTSVPEVLSYSLESPSLFHIEYSEEVTIEEALLEDEKISILYASSSFDIPLPDLQLGVQYELYITAADGRGNTARSAFLLTGPNGFVPETVINELSLEAPDRIELLFLEEGLTAGMIIKDGTDEEHTHSFLLPSLSVSPGDIMTIWWNSEAEEDESRIREDGNMTYNIPAGADSGLIGTNGAIILYEREGGDIIDGVIYTTGESELADGFGNLRTEASYWLLTESGEWEGKPVPSNDVTSSRMLARIPGGYDTDTAEDWFTTAPRFSTIGELNAYAPYEK